MKIQDATTAYETWLQSFITWVPEDLEHKHRCMAQNPFLFLRATYYHWAMRFPTVCRLLMDAPAILAIGDIHIENFGTWRDAEGRLVWGINDFDEAAVLPYANDLVRLAVSMRLADVTMSTEKICRLILRGYVAGLKDGRNDRATPFILAEDHARLRKFALRRFDKAKAYWQNKVKDTYIDPTDLPAHAWSVLEQQLPQPEPRFRLAPHRGGRGSLGRQRWVAIGEWCGATFGREIKALAPSASVWLAGGTVDLNVGAVYQQILDRAVRASDPFFHLERNWLVRRLAPDCDKVTVDELTSENEVAYLLVLMGCEIANVHLGSPDAGSAILSDIKRRPPDWLVRATQAMDQIVRDDWKAWKTHWRVLQRPR